MLLAPSPGFTESCRRVFQELLLAVSLLPPASRKVALKLRRCHRWRAPHRTGRTTVTGRGLAHSVPRWDTDDSEHPSNPPCHLCPHRLVPMGSQRPRQQSPTRRTSVSFHTASGTGAPGPRVEGAGPALAVRRPSSPPARFRVSRSLCRSSFRLHRMHKATTSSSSGSGDGCLKPCRRQTEFSTGWPWAPLSAGWSSWGSAPRAVGSGSWSCFSDFLALIYQKPRNGV